MNSPSKSVKRMKNKGSWSFVSHGQGIFQGNQVTGSDWWRGMNVNIIAYVS